MLLDCIIKGQNFIKACRQADVDNDVIYTMIQIIIEEESKGREDSEFIEEINK